MVEFLLIIGEPYYYGNWSHRFRLIEWSCCLQCFACKLTSFSHSVLYLWLISGIVLQPLFFILYVFGILVRFVSSFFLIGGKRTQRVILQFLNGKTNWRTLSCHARTLHSFGIWYLVSWKVEGYFIVTWRRRCAINAILFTLWRYYVIESGFLSIIHFQSCDTSSVWYTNFIESFDIKKWCSLLRSNLLKH